MKALRGALTCAAMLLAGCHGAPTVQEEANAYYGSYPTNYQIIIHSFYNSSLKDPDSAIFKEISEPLKSYLGNRITGVKYGYKICVTLNAKNSFGAYVGYKTDAFIINDGTIVETIPDIDSFMPGEC